MEENKYPDKIKVCYDAYLVGKEIRNYLAVVDDGTGDCREYVRSDLYSKLLIELDHLKVVPKLQDREYKDLVEIHKKRIKQVGKLKLKLRKKNRENFKLRQRYTKKSIVDFVYDNLSGGMNADEIIEVLYNYLNRDDKAIDSM